MGNFRKASFRLSTPTIASLAVLSALVVLPPIICASNQTNSHPIIPHVTVVKVSVGDTVQGKTLKKTRWSIHLIEIDTHEMKLEAKLSHA